MGKEFMPTTVDWREEVKAMLVEAGTIGLSQTTLTNRVYPLGVRAKELKGFLESYRAQDGIQRFTQGKLVTWRATTKLLKLV